eukprot:30937-Pelagococcus_subviridis.AAC.42
MMTADGPALSQFVGSPLSSHPRRLSNPPSITNTFPNPRDESAIATGTAFGPITMIFFPLFAFFSDATINANASISNFPRAPTCSVSTTTTLPPRTSGTPLSCAAPSRTSTSSAPSRTSSNAATAETSPAYPRAVFASGPTHSGDVANSTAPVATTAVSVAPSRALAASSVVSSASANAGTTRSTALETPRAAEEKSTSTPALFALDDAALSALSTPPPMDFSTRSTFFFTSGAACLVALDTSSVALETNGVASLTASSTSGASRSIAGESASLAVVAASEARAKTPTTAFTLSSTEETNDSIASLSAAASAAGIGANATSPAGTPTTIAAFLPSIAATVDDAFEATRLDARLDARAGRAVDARVVVASIVATVMSTRWVRRGRARCGATRVTAVRFLRCCHLATEDESDSRAKSMLSCLLWLGRNRSALLGLVESS